MIRCFFVFESDSFVSRVATLGRIIFSCLRFGRFLVITAVRSWFLSSFLVIRKLIRVYWVCISGL